MKIAVLMGGNSEEREVSLASGAEVARALREAGHDVVAVDTTRGVLPPDEESKILDAGVRIEPPPPDALDLLDTGDTTALTRNPEVAGADVIFLALHGGAGEDGTIQALLDLTGLPYAGSGRVGCALAMDKDLTKRLLRGGGVPTLDWRMAPGDLTELEPDEVVEALGLPLIVKPSSGGSTLGLTLVRDAAEIPAAVELAGEYDEAVMFEAYVKGRELTVGILGQDALPVGEIIPEHELFDYECKYQPGMAQEIFPAEISDDLAGRARELALKTHRLLRLEGYSRVDFILDGDGELWCLEANALPGMTSNSLVPKAARAAGISFPELCDRICRLALENRDHRRESSSGAAS